MKKSISAVLVAAMLTSGAGSVFAAPTDVSNKCMHLNEMIENGYWTNGKKPVCGCDSCQVVLADYDHLDRVFDKSNARMFSKDMTGVLETYYEDEDWQRGDYLLMSCDRKNGTIYASFNKKDQSFNFENLDSEQQDKYKKALEEFVDTIKSIQDKNTSNEKAIQIRTARFIEGIRQCDIESYMHLDKADKAKKGVMIAGALLSLIPIFKGLKRAWNTSVPKSIEDRATGKSSAINWKDEIQFAGKVFLTFAGAIILPVFIMLGSDKLGDYWSNKIISQHTCPMYIDDFPNFS